MRARFINILVFVCLTASVFAQKPFTVVLDPGHGGKDYGCIGTKVNEKSVVLDVALQVGEILAKEQSGIKTVYTRSDDRFIPLNDRAAIANKAAADLFVSIHVNSVDKKTRGREKIHGASVYTLGLHRSDDNLNVAMRENSVIELEPDYSETYQGFDPNSTESYIIFELTQNRHLWQSIELADEIQQQLVKEAGRADKGVLQSGFLVLRATSMPAVLVELDFICNPQAEDFLASADGRQKCARSVADAIQTYYRRYGKSSSPATKDTDAPGVATQQSVAVNMKQPQEGKDWFYSIQISSLPSPIDISSKYPDFKDIVETRADNSVKYSVGRFRTLKEAKKELVEIKKSIPDAFIVKLRP